MFLQIVSKPQYAKQMVQGTERGVWGTGLRAQSTEHRAWGWWLSDLQMQSKNLTNVHANRIEATVRKANGTGYGAWSMGRCLEIEVSSL
jgi:hypothetical protein